MHTKTSKNRVLGSFALAMISVSAILSLREFAIMATVGVQAVAFFLVALLGFFLPSALVCAELATAFSEEGGIYTWVSQAFGHHVGFVAIWLEWINNVISFPARLATIVVTLAYVGLPVLAANKYLLFVVMMLIYWGCTLFNFLNIKDSSKLNVLGGLFGSLFISIFITALGVAWVWQGHPAEISWRQPWLPDLNIGNLALFLSVLSAFSGMQVTSFHAPNVRSPQKSFPRAIFFTMVAVFSLSVCATLAIAIVVPAHKINLISGVIEGFSVLLQKFGLVSLTPVLALLLSVAAVATLSAWVIAPARGLHGMALKEHLPPVLAVTNRHGMPVNILLLQGVVGTLLALLFVFLPTLETAFWLLIALTSQFTVMMWILIFASAIRLRYTPTEIKRHFRIPGGNGVLWLIAALGITTCSVGFVLGFLPLEKVQFASTLAYALSVLVIDIVIIGAPLLLIVVRTRKKFDTRSNY